MLKDHVRKQLKERNTYVFGFGDEYSAAEAVRVDAKTSRPIDRKGLTGGSNIFNSTFNSAFTFSKNAAPPITANSNFNARLATAPQVVENTKAVKLDRINIQEQQIPMFGTQPADETMKSTMLSGPSQLTRISKTPLAVGKRNVNFSRLSQDKTSKNITQNSQELFFEGDEADLVFSIEMLRMSTVAMNKTTKQKFAMLRKLHKRVDNDFLDKRVEPRFVMFVASDIDVKTLNQPRYATWEPENKSNVLINVNKYIAKYDFDIADKLKYNPMIRKLEVEINFKRAAIYEILNLCSFEITKHVKTFQSVWTTQGKQITDLNEIPLDCEILIVSEQPMIADQQNYLKQRREHNVPHSIDSQNQNRKPGHDQSQVAQGLSSMIGNEFRVKDWEHYYQISSFKIAEKLNTTKTNWCQNNFNEWIGLTQQKVEASNIMHETRTQTYGPHVSGRIATHDNDYPKSKEDFKFSSRTTPHEPGSRQEKTRQSKMQVIQWKINQHQHDQREILSNTTFFKFNHLNPNLPQNLKMIVDSEKIVELSKFNKKLTVGEDTNVTVVQMTEQSDAELLQKTQKVKMPKHDTGIAVMPTEQVEKYATKFKLLWKDIYQLHSEFNSFSKIEIQEIEREIENKQKKIFDVTNSSSNKTKLQIVKLQEKLAKAQANRQVNLDTLLKFSDLGNQMFEDITCRIVSSFGVDGSNKNAVIDFQTFCRINCLLKYHTISGSELIKIWIKILNPAGVNTLHRNEMVDFFERFARGSMTEQPSLLSHTFALHMLDLFKMEDCLDELDRVDMNMLQNKIETEIFDIALFNQLITPDCSYQVWSKNITID